MSDKLSKHELFLIFSLNITQQKFCIDNCGCDCGMCVCKIFYICESDITKYVSSDTNQESGTNNNGTCAGAIYWG